MIRAWLFLIPRVIVRTITGSALRPFTWELRKSLRNQQHQVPALEILPSYRTHSRELWHSNPEIRRSLGFLSPILPAPSCFLASSVPGHDQKQRTILVL
jgi:hypothetical protein